MAETVSFPGLGLSFEVSRVAFSIGNYSIYWYGITFALGFLLGIAYFHFRARKFGIHPYDGMDVILWAVVGGVIGARAYFVIFQWDNYKDNLLKIFAFREGGLAIYGGVIGAVLAGWLVCKIKKAPFLPILDAGLTGLLLAQGIGRWGNFFNNEAFGCNTTLPWGMTSDTISRYLFNHAEALAAQGVIVDPTVPVHPTFFYEFVWNVLGFLFLAFILTPRRKYDGQVTLGYMAWYGLGRFFIEGLRTDSLMLGQYRVSQMLALILCIGSLLLMVAIHFYRKKNPKPLYVDTDVSKERIAQVERELAEEKERARQKKEGKKNGGAPQVDEPSGEAAAVTEETGEGEESPETPGTGEEGNSGEKAPDPEDAGEAQEDSGAASEETAGEAGAVEEPAARESLQDGEKTDEEKKDETSGI
jgi:phosphatidylglycerol:prolipoprotein diacylglycerol transferase